MAFVIIRTSDGKDFGPNAVQKLKRQADVLTVLLKPKSVIRPKQGNYQDIIASFQLLSAFLSASCFHLRIDTARYAFNTGCRNLLETNTNKIWNLMTDLG